MFAGDAGGRPRCPTAVGPRGSRGRGRDAVPDGCFDAVIAAEVLGAHPGRPGRDGRDLPGCWRPGGIAAVTVPSWLPERICWRLSDDYHNVPRRSRADLLPGPSWRPSFARSGLQPGGHHHAHALPLTVLWLKMRPSGSAMTIIPLARAYHRVLVWDIMKKPRVDPGSPTACSTR